MHRRVVMIFAAVAAVLGSAPIAFAGAATAAAVVTSVGAGGSWGQARPVPGLAALKADMAQLVSVSCASAGNCGAGGFYATATGTQAFVVAEIKGRWGNAIEVPGLGPLNTNGSALVASVSCPAAGHCVAGGFYSVLAGSKAFVVAYGNGRWGGAMTLPGTLNIAGNAGVTSVSCGSVDNCAAVGQYTDTHGRQQAFVTTETRGRWARAVEIPGLGALNTQGDATITSVSCPSAGNCVAGGSYANTSGSLAFVVAEVAGQWHKAVPVTGLVGPSKNQYALVTAVSCGSAGACAAGGFYTDRAGNAEAFVVGEANGRWSKAEPVPGLSTLSKGGGSGVNSVSCPPVGGCAAAGSYGHGSVLNGFVVTQTNGRWGQAEAVPGLAGLNKGQNASVTSVSCPARGDCAAAGSYLAHVGNQQAFVVNELNGRWGKAEEVPGTATLNKGLFGTVASLSCPSAGHCVAGGYYSDGLLHSQAFTDAQS